MGYGKEGLSVVGSVFGDDFVKFLFDGVAVAGPEAGETDLVPVHVHDADGNAHHEDEDLAALDPNATIRSTSGLRN
jgi:hypothetical protein